MRQYYILAGLGFIAVTLAVSPAHADLVALWHFDEPTGILVGDSANGHHGTATPDIVPSTDRPFLPAGNAMSRSFPGDFSAGHISVPDHGDLDLTGDFTIEAWIKRGSTGHSGHIVNKHMHSAPSGGSWGLEAPSQGRLSFYVARGLGIPNINVPSEIGAVPASQWVHIAFSYFEPSDHYDFYVDGDPAGSGTAGIAGLIGDTPFDLWFGSVNADWERSSFDGKMDEVQIWNECRSQDDVRLDMGIPEPVSLVSGLIALGMVGTYMRKRGLA